VFLGSIMSSEKTAAAAGTVGEVRFDPFAMLPFTGYNVGDYFAHWLDIGRATDPAKLPGLFWVNWFRKDTDGSFMWPGFGENSRVLKWVLERVAGDSDAVDTPIGRVPTVDALDTDGLDLDATTVAKLLTVDGDAWRQEVVLIEGHYDGVGERLPDELRDELAELEKRLSQ
jgi:phosphoenolpyruvate carboxykinase (GTP)